MNETLALFTALFIVTIIPGPLAIVAFYGGTRGLAPFLAGLAGQLLGLIIVSNLIVIVGGSTGITNNSWFLPLAAISLIWLGLRIFSADKKGRPADTLTFASTFMMAAANPKAILGFGPPLLLFHRNGPDISLLIYSTAILVTAVSLSMVFYFFLGMILKNSKVVKYIRKGSGIFLASFGALILMREVWNATGM